MKVNISNTGDHPIRVILNHDTVNDSTLEAGADQDYEATEGVIELRELEIGSDDAPG